jgi:flagellar hook-length control protein FliK
LALNERRDTGATLDAVKMLASADNTHPDARGGSGDGRGDGTADAGSALVAAQAASLQAATRMAGINTGSIAAEVGTPAFRGELAEQVKLMVGRAAEDGTGTVREARLTLNPADLGPITIRIALDGQSARVDFMAVSETTQRALSESMPDLAAALNTEGLTLTGGGVHQQAPDARQHGAQQGAQAGGSGQPEGLRGAVQSTLSLGGASNGLTTTSRSRPDGMLDLYA